MKKRLQTAIYAASLLACCAAAPAAHAFPHRGGWYGRPYFGAYSYPYYAAPVYAAPAYYEPAYTPAYVAPAALTPPPPPPAPPETYVDGEANTYCREYSQHIRVNGKMQESYGTACLQPDGNWRIQNPQ